MQRNYREPLTDQQWKCFCIPQEGSKGRLVANLLWRIPAKGRWFVDLFAGGGTVSLNVMGTKQYAKYFINDLYTAKLFRAILAVRGQCGILPRTRETYEVFCEIVKQHPDWPLAVIWERCMTLQAGKWGRGYGVRGVKPENYSRTVARAYGLMEKCHPVITQKDWREFPLTDCTWDDMVFVDPPYQGTDTALYDSKNFDHRPLVDALAGAKFRWMLCGYDNLLYRKVFGSPRFSAESWTPRGVKAGHGSRTRIECVWANYDLPGLKGKIKEIWKK
jgi:hypothetical protein